MKKILIGICGIGNGHINRQITICQYLLSKYKCSILIATQRSKLSVIQKLLPSVHTVEVSIPWIACTSAGLDYKASLIAYEKNPVDQFKSFFEFCLSVENFFSGKPDFVISDYEPNSARYAYTSLLPLISMEQQAKFLYLPSIAVKNHSALEETTRINYFFPSFHTRIISSFFPIDISDSRVIVTRPIIQSLSRVTFNLNSVVVYFSPYSDSEIYNRVLHSIQKINRFHFNVYSNSPQYYAEKYPASNISFKPFSNEFKKDLQNSCAILTSAGHQLISEAISLNLPLYVYPLNTYEQAYNAYMVQRYHIGEAHSNVSSSSIQSFLDAKESYFKNICAFKKSYCNCDWKDALSQTIESLAK